METLVEMEIKAAMICNQSDGLMKQKAQEIREMEEKDEKSKMQDLQ